MNKISDPTSNRSSFRKSVFKHLCSPYLIIVIAFALGLIAATSIGQHSKGLIEATEIAPFKK